MRIGVFDHGWWAPACEALGHDPVGLPVAAGSDGNPYHADLSQRISGAQAVAERFAQAPPDFLIDNGGTGLSFAAGVNGANADIRPLHEALDRPLLSHFIDPLVTAFEGLDWSVLWQSLASPNWVKMVWDQAQVHELRQFGVDNVIHVPMAAPDRHYDTSSPDPGHVRPVVSFVGGQNTSFFQHGHQTPTISLFAGTLAAGVRSDLPDAIFYDIYHNVYGLGLPIQKDDSPAVRAEKTRAYFAAKLFHNVHLCIKNRDRFVIYLKRTLGDAFELVGRGWDTAYGLPTGTPFPTTDQYLQHFREVAININLVNGNAETGLNMRHFEITAAGGFMLCYQQPELAAHFVIGKECDVFRNENELIEKVQYYLAHPDERSAIALAGQRRTLAQHLHRHRLQSVLRLLMPHKAPVTFSGTTWSEDFKTFVPQAKVILDCGANVGQMARSFRHLYENADIYSFEPVGTCFSELERTCAEIGVKPVKKAVSDHDGVCKINLTTSPECHSLLGYEPSNPCEQYTWIVDEEEVDVCSLDNWCAQNDIDTKTIDIIKLDVQGAELQALRGATKILKSAKMVLAEVSFVPLYKDSPLFGEVDDFMKQAGYDRAALYPSDQPQHWGDALYVKKNLV